MSLSYGDKLMNRSFPEAVAVCLPNTTGRSSNKLKYRLIQLAHSLHPTLRMLNSLIQESGTDGSMDYFAYSPFWDPKSNNNVLRVQRRIEQPTYGHAEEKLYVRYLLSSFLLVRLKRGKHEGKYREKS